MPITIKRILETSDGNRFELVEELSPYGHVKVYKNSELIVDVVKSDWYEFTRG